MVVSTTIVNKVAKALDYNSTACNHISEFTNVLCVSDRLVKGLSKASGGKNREVRVLGL